MTTSPALQSLQRLIAVHPACPLSLKHDGAWQLRSYKVETVLRSSHCAEQRKAKCSRCGAAIVMLAYDLTKVPLEELESVQKLVLKSCGIQHAHLHLPWAAFEDSGYFCVLYPHMDKANLIAEMQAEGGKLTERQAVQKVAQPCLTALADLHAKGISHGALLPHNVLFSSQEQSCKLAGLFLDSELVSTAADAALQCFAAPEQDAASPDSLMQSASAAADIFMLGALTYEVLVGKHAFPAKDDGLGRARRWQEPDMPLWLSDQAQDFLSKTLLKDPARRSIAVQLLKHPWLKSLGFKQPPDAVPSSIEIVEPVLPPRPVVQPVIAPVVIAEPVAVEEEAVEAAVEEAVAAPQEVAVTATVTVAEPASAAPLNRSGKRHSMAKSSDALETGWDLFYKSGNSATKAKAKPKMVIPKVVGGSASRRGTAQVSKDAAGDKKTNT